MSCPRMWYLSVQGVSGQPGLQAAPSPPGPYSHQGAVSHAGALCWQGPGGWLSLWSGKACPSPGRDAPRLFLAAHHTRAQGQPQRRSGQGLGSAVKRPQSSAWMSCWGAGEHCPDSQTATKTQNHHGQTPQDPCHPRAEEASQHCQESAGSAAASCPSLPLCPGEGDSLLCLAYLVVRIGVEQSFLVTQLRCGGQ